MVVVSNRKQSSRKLNYRQRTTIIARLSRELERWEVQQSLSGSHERKGAFLTIQATAKDLDAEQWVERLLRMYTRWGEHKGYGMRLVDEICFGVNIRIFRIHFGNCRGLCLWHSKS